ncbi:MAG TPA: hypothetical protein PKC55_16720 [Dysgonomonas sp.]|uniref:hypothetical protein n=1 Tax=unclassified Dysgonomonas TaxID=2630389 RepID=UPI0025C2CF47|nr:MULTISPECIES: hypothetical protein [unclassified Dysgonomonas]HML66474.1 hypothetical protein [Dysgonomonas sp.]
MKKFIIVFIIMIGFLFSSKSAFAQENINLEFPGSCYSFVKKEGAFLHFSWKFPVDIGGEPYEGYTAFEMLLYAVYRNSPNCFGFDGLWEVTKKDEIYLYGYATIYISSDIPESVRTLTIKGIENGPIVINIY